MKIQEKKGKERRERESDIVKKEKKKRERMKVMRSWSNLRVPVRGRGSNFLHVIIL